MLIFRLYDKKNYEENIMSNIKVFENKKIRTKWNEQEEDWYFSLVDIVAVLADTTNPTEYLKKMR